MNYTRGRIRGSLAMSGTSGRGGAEGRGRSDVATRPLLNIGVKRARRDEACATDGIGVEPDALRGGKIPSCGLIIVPPCGSEGGFILKAGGIICQVCIRSRRHHTTTSDHEKTRIL